MNSSRNSSSGSRLTVPIYKLLKEQNLTQTKAAELLGTTQAQISALMRLPARVSVRRPTDGISHYSRPGFTVGKFQRLRNQRNRTQSAAMARRNIFRSRSRCSAVDFNTDRFQMAAKRSIVGPPAGQ